MHISIRYNFDYHPFPRDSFAYEMMRKCATRQRNNWAVFCHSTMAGIANFCLEIVWITILFVIWPSLLLWQKYYICYGNFICFHRIFFPSQMSKVLILKEAFLDKIWWFHDSLFLQMQKLQLEIWIHFCPDRKLILVNFLLSTIVKKCHASKVNWENRLVHILQMYFLKRLSIFGQT